MDVFKREKLSGNGYYTSRAQSFFEEKYKIGKTLLTTSCTDALEMAALLLNLKAGDEVILPSFTFVSTANAFALRGVKLIFADSQLSNPNIDLDEIESLITINTKVIVVVYYAGIAIDMDKLLLIAKKYNLFIVEDAAQAIDSFYREKALGSFGDFSTFSFHETKNLIAGEAGLLGINNDQFKEKAEIVWEKGTNRSAFIRGEVNKYNWVSLGSSFLPTEIVASFLVGQLEILDLIQERRKSIWNTYDSLFREDLRNYQILLPHIPDYGTNNAHMYYLVFKESKHRNDFIAHMAKNKIQTASHYISLHKSPYFQDQHDGRNLPNSDMYSDCLVRLPLFYNLGNLDQQKIIEKVLDFCKSQF
jgi:dTDP-4-amino-4,6-dideoxygalactose transaminase